MKINQKTVEITLYAVLAGILLYMLAPELYGRFYYIPKKFKPPHEHASIKEIEANVGSQLLLTSRKMNNEMLQIGEGPLLFWTWSSGPPMYIFNKDGILIDYTTDSGDDRDFKEKWLKESIK